MVSLFSSRLADEFARSHHEDHGRPLRRRMAARAVQQIRHSLRGDDEIKSDMYVDLLPLINSRQIDLLDHTKLINQLCSLERRTARSGRDSIDHPPHGHDDLINAVAGLAAAVTKQSAYNLDALAAEATSALRRPRHVTSCRR